MQSDSINGVSRKNQNRPKGAEVLLPSIDRWFYSRSVLETGNRKAVISEACVEVSLDTFICSPDSRGRPGATSSWLILRFIPAAFSQSCPTEILAFQKSHEEFLKRNCKVLFVSVDTRNSLWYWQSIPRKDGGLGHIDIPLLSDLDNSIARNYGVVVEELGIDIRGMFLIDGDGVVQQVSVQTLVRSVIA